MPVPATGSTPEPEGLAGPVTSTPPGGIADLRNVSVAEVVDSAFDDLAHTPDFPPATGVTLGRYAIPKLNLHLFRQQAYELRRVTPLDFGAGRYALDPSGRDIQLFMPSQRIGGSTSCHRAPALGGAWAGCHVG